MRYHPEDKKKTRLRIVKVAARRFSAEGLASVGIANLMADLGMTHGGFYAHFTDKEALVTAACAEAFDELLRRWNGLAKTLDADEALCALINDYLSRHHREHPETGCFAVAVASEIARRDHRSRQAFTIGIEQQLKLLGSLQQDLQPTMPPEAILSLMVGAMLLARTVSDPELSTRLLNTASAAALGKRSI